MILTTRREGIRIGGKGDHLKISEQDHIRTQKGKTEVMHFWYLKKKKLNAQVKFLTAFCDALRVRVSVTRNHPSSLARHEQHREVTVFVLTLAARTHHD